MKIFIIIYSFLITTLSYGTPELLATEKLANDVKEPELYLKNKGNLVILGNSSLENAHIIFLPEVHDDAESLRIQLMVIAQEKKKGLPFVILDESLASMKRSIWDIFSQKSLEIITAQKNKQAQELYAPRQFERSLKELAEKLQRIPGQLNHDRSSDLWTLKSFKDDALPFYGWDLGQKGTLLERNVQMVKSLKEALKRHSRVLVMAGARHIPELEFLTSKKLLCNQNGLSSVEQYFAQIERKYGQYPDIEFGIGATAPIFNFLAGQSYAIVFSQDLYQPLQKALEQFKRRGSSCLRL
jgi:hypothetical protein